ncbi:MAG: phosphoribosylglycinamide formyltransferase [Polyangiaceae bacterium]|jgi:phosphoribosylglycinamide formyltransferase-1|nr:phosphoribosylglycinamide formyltransferase [Polyangiaceae bacterium]
MSPGKLALGVLCSGGGTNLQAILDACAAGALDAEVRVVIANVEGAFALERAKAAGVPALCLPHRAHPDRASYDRALAASLREAGAELIVLAGFMRLVTPALLDAFPRRVINIHPGLSPAFPGVDAQAQALAYGAAVAGCTVHFVDAGTDSGPIIAQAVVPVRDDDTRDALAARILRQEHRLLVEVLRWLAAGEVRVEAAPSGGRPRVRVPGRSRARGLADDGA